MDRNRLATALFTICGPKGSLCCSVLSVWGVVMMIGLGAAFKLQAVALFEDIEGKIAFENKTTHVHFSSDTIRKNVDTAYDNAAYACFGAAFLYVLFLAFSSVMVGVNVFKAKNAAGRKRR